MYVNPQHFGKCILGAQPINLGSVDSAEERNPWTGFSNKAPVITWSARTELTFRISTVLPISETVSISTLGTL